MRKVVSLNCTQWWENSILYSAYLDKFAGTFSAFTKRLDYLSRLGIDCIHILPFYPSPMFDDGYDVSDYCNIRPELGTLKDFSAFAAAAQSAGIRIMIDLVLNHTSTEHPWFLEAKSSRNNPKRNFYLWSETGKEYAAAPNPLAGAKPPEFKSTWIWNPETGDYFFSTFYHKQADLNWNNPDVFSSMMSVVDFWAGLGVDGFRLDAASHLIKKDGTSCVGIPETHAALKKIRAYLDSRHPDVALLGEASGQDSIQTLKTYFGNGDECHLVYDFPLAGQLFLSLRRKDPGILKKFIGESSGIPTNSQFATFLRHHDEMAIDGLPENENKELLGYFDPEGKYLFNHGIAMRLATMFRGNKQKILDSFKLLFDVPGSLIIYYGDEIGMENEPLALGEKDTRRSVRGKFDWSKADAQRDDSESLLNNITNMIRARKRRPVQDSNRS